MNANHDHDDDLLACNAPLDALLRERVGSESPPDLTQVIVGRHARGEGTHVAERIAISADPVQTHTSRNLLIAALVLLGVGAVIGTVLTKNSTKPQNDRQAAAIASPEAALPELQDPKPLGNDAFALKVEDRHGGPVQQFHVAVLRVNPNNPANYAPVTSMLDIVKTPKDFDGPFTTVSGLPAGTYAVSISDGMHAMTISDPFEVGKLAPQITVRMNLGGIVRGTVRDEQGVPVANAIVRSAAPRKAKAEIFRALQSLAEASNRVVRTKRVTRTAKDGSFELSKLTYGEYAIEVEHPDYCPLSSSEVLVGKKPTTLELTTRLGANVFGNIQLGSGAAANYVVILTGRPKNGQGALSYRTRTDAKGNYRFDVRVAPGGYTLSSHAEKRNVENPFEVLLAIKRSQSHFSIEKGQDKHEKNLQLK